MSNLIKSGRVVTLEDLKQLELVQRIAAQPHNISGSDGDFGGNEQPDAETASLRDRLLRDAEDTAREMLDRSREEAADIRAAAEREAEEWWLSRRAEDEALAEQARQTGYSEGYAAGMGQAEADVRMEWQDRMAEARSMVESAYVTKERVIAEAETFVVELSCKIAEALLRRELNDSPEWMVQLFKQALGRRKEQGVITLCVSPGQFDFVQAAKDELVLALDSQADLQIVPDPSVGEGGCIVRSAFGSIDARIDTQLSAVRSELLRVAAHAAEEGNSDAAP